MIKTITQIPEPIQTPITILKASNAVRSNKQTNKRDLIKMVILLSMWHAVVYQ